MLAKWRKHLPNIGKCVALILVACILASIYGALHNQVSYTVSPEAFIQIYFFQFGVVRGGAERWDAALIGIQATWWMGLYIGGVLAPLGVFFGDGVSKTWNVVRAYGVVALTAATTYFVVLAVTHFVPKISFYKEFFGFYIYCVVEDEYGRAMITHDASYVGGFLGIAFGASYLLKRNKRLRTSSLAGLPRGGQTVNQ
jgi:hypothetical protein